MSDWTPFEAALGAAAEAGRPVPFWWRDDDSVAATPALERLLALRARYDAALAIAAIPAGIEPSLPERLRGEPGTRVLVHGLAHRNHAPPGLPKAEFGPTRDREEVRRDAAEALARAQAAFGRALVPAFVPPWNRLAPDLAPMLQALGYAAISAFGRTERGSGSEALPRIDTHLDPIDWRGQRGLVDPCELVTRLSRAVLARLEGGAPEPIGLLTHHLVHDEEVWGFCEELLERLSRSPGARLAGIEGLLPAEAERGYGTDAAT